MNVGDTDGSRKTLKVQRTTSGAQFWGGFFETSLYVNHDVNYNVGTYVWVGDEMPNTGSGEWNGNTTLCGKWGSGSNAVDWQRTADAWDGVTSSNWTTIQSASSYTESTHWHVQSPPTPLQIYFENNSC
jgi:hypothetical protein